MAEPSALDVATTSSTNRSSPPTVRLPSQIVEVVVHSQGAIVTRRVEFDDVPEEGFDLVCGGITLSAQTHGLRCEVTRGDWLVRSVRSRLEVPQEDEGPGPARARVEELGRQLRRLNEEHRAIESRLRHFDKTVVSPNTGRSLVEEGAGSRVDSALNAVELLDERIEHLHERLAEVEREHRKVSREREAALVDERQVSDSERDGAGAPSREVVMSIGPGSGGGEITFSYVVEDARWWPTYTLRIDDDGRSASLLVEALVAQSSGEDWESVRLGLATSEIVSDAQLPKMPSFRLGRAQPEPRRGFRAPPKGVERLFMSFDLALGSTVPAVPASAPPRSTGEGPTGVRAEDSSRLSMKERGAADDADDEIAYDQVQLQAPSRSMARAPAPKRSRKKGAPPPAAAFGAVPGAPGAGGGGAPAPMKPAAAAPSQIEPDDDWLRFDDVVLAPLSAADRGKLRRRGVDFDVVRGSIREASERAQFMGCVHPWLSRGNYDHRYDAEAAVDVPSDGALHRVEIVAAACPSSLAWRTNPREDSAVYREVTLDNPHPSPLLAGPLDVYVRGSLVANTKIATVDRGGTMTVGLGVDERLRVARNARVREESAGLLGGKREIDHFVDIEIVSSLGFDAMIEVVDRIPVSRDEHVEVELFESVPPGEEYDQTDRDEPVEGGRRWRVEVLAGDEATIRFAYRVKLRAKDELIGGNRRE